MPVMPTYPGVYIEELPSAIRTISGVATSVTAFIGRAYRGPTNEPVIINGFLDFERVFGGLWLESTLGFAVRDFFQNGGGQAVIIRLYRQRLSERTTAILTRGSFTLKAASEGAWGKHLRMRIEIEDTATPLAKDIANRLGVPPEQVFSLLVRDGGTGEVEEFRNVTVVESARRIDRVLESGSRLVRVNGDSVGEQPPLAHGTPSPGEYIWALDNNPLDKLSTGINEETGSASNGDPLDQNSFIGVDFESRKHGLYALEKTDIFNLLCIPPYRDGARIEDRLLADAAAYCGRRRAILLIDSSMPDKEQAKGEHTTVSQQLGGNKKNSAYYFPRLRQANPLRENRLEDMAPCGAVAGVIARTDVTRGVWKAAAGLDAAISGTAALTVDLTDPENGELNPLGINCLRTRPAAGHVVWGARTLDGDDRLASEWKYLPVRRLALFIEESLYRGTQWVVFEPNDEPLWAQIRLSIGAFMNSLFRQGAFQGRTPREAYLVKCDAETTTQNDINRGIVNILVGFAPLKPAEFVIIKIQQLAGQVQV